MPRPIEVEREVLARALEETNWNKSAAARRLKICREALRKQIDKHGLVQPDPEPTPEPEELTVKEEHRLKVENRLLKRRLQDLLDASVREDDMRNLFLSCAELDLNPPAWLEPPKRGGPERAIATALLSDCHFDEVVNPAEFNWRNGYNRAIAEQRLRNFFDGVLSLSGEVINGVKMEQMVLAMAGDMLSGNIHEELRQTNEVPILDSVLHWSEQLAAGIERLLGTFSEVYVSCVVGNHGRIDKKPRYKLRVKENYDWLLYHVVAKHFRGTQEVTFAIPESTDHSWPVYRTRYLMTHGDQFQGGSDFLSLFVKLAEHHAAEFDAANAAFQIDGVHQADAGILQRWNVRQEGPGIQKNRVAADRPDHGYTERPQFLAKVLNRCMPIYLVVVVEGL